MRDITNLRDGAGREYLGASQSRGTEQSIRLHFEAGGAVSKFLKNVVADQFTRERAGCRDLGDRGSGAGPTRNDEAIVDFRVLPRTETPEHGDTSVKIPMWKRLLDLAIICLSWPFWFPLMVSIMCAIKVSSAGPVFYRQERVGYRGRRFMIFKFRTMKVNVDTSVHESHFERLIATDSPMTKLDAHGDPRLIKGGRFLRAAGLDELPQIFNVLRGEMSLVGARPCTVHEFERYQPWQRERVNGPPGLTGYWQVNGKNKTTFSEMIEMDIFYGKNMCVLLDLSIIFRTIPAIVVHVLETRGITLWWKRNEGPKIPHLS